MPQLLAAAITAALIATSAAAWDGMIAIDDATVLTFGMANGATDGLDPGLGEEQLPPLPPGEATRDVRFLPVDSFTDYRSASGAATWTVRSNTPLTGELAVLAPGVVTINGGSVAPLVYLLAGDNVIEFTAGTCSHTMELVRGWQMVSSPCAAEFPGVLWMYDRGYRTTNNLAPGAGYMLYSDRRKNVTVTGSTWTATPPAPSAWRIIGVAAEMKPLYPAWTLSTAGYQRAGMLMPGIGYWHAHRTSASKPIPLPPTPTTWGGVKRDRR